MLFAVEFDTVRCRQTTCSAVCGWWLVLICYERKVLLMVASRTERKSDAPIKYFEQWVSMHIFYAPLVLASSIALARLIRFTPTFCYFLLKYYVSTATNFSIISKVYWIQVYIDILLFYYFKSLYTLNSWKQKQYSIMGDGSACVYAYIVHI